MKKRVFLFADHTAPRTQVGGKGFSLIEMTAGGFPVPDGFVLGVDFFEEWLAQLRALTDIQMLDSDSVGTLAAKAAALKEAARSFTFSDTQRREFEAALQSLGFREGHSYSVRSSSPEEDMEGASFAGMYETYLGVPYDQLLERIRDVFISCLDERVIAYKRRKGFDFTSYSIAVIVMSQIDSEVAGVAFSINPLDNCYDEVVINANFGLGESVVSGSAVPDEFIVDKVHGEIRSRKIGDKKKSIVIQTGGGTCEVSSNTAGRSSLSDEQVLELAQIAMKAEAHYGKPVDTEWAYAKGKFHMLQARPVTTYIPLHPAFLTEPGKPKKLYLDLTLVEQGIQKPLSVMGTDCFRILSNEMGVSACGIPIAEKPGDLVYAAGGRAYVNLTAEMLLEGQKGTAMEYEGLDSYAAQIIREADISPYRGKATFDGVWKTLRGVVTGMFRSTDTIAGIIQGNRHPERLREKIDAEGESLIEKLDRLDESGISFAEFVHRSMRSVADFMVHVSIPSLVDAESAKKGLKKLIENDPNCDELLAEVDMIDRALPFNVTIDMNCRIYELMTLLPPEDLESTTELQRKLEERNLPKTFLAKWDEFIKRYGFRGPREIDIKTPRYGDDFTILIQQMQSYRELNEEDSPSAIFRRQARERKDAYERLLQKVKNSTKLEKLYHVLVNLGGYREIHKYYLVYAGNLIRQRAAAIAQMLVDTNRIDDLNDVFNLTPTDLQRIIDTPTDDARALIAQNREFMSTVELIDQFPPVIDSRGRILRPKRKFVAEGQLQGDPVSAGKVRGKAVIVNYVGEKTIAKGDILVAKASDPGWTPLFINASGILLEVGGMLQHGSLIAREYGKPCIAGIQGLTSSLKDGDMIEMDGATGIVQNMSITPLAGAV